MPWWIISCLTAVLAISCLYMALKLMPSWTISCFLRGFRANALMNQFLFVRGFRVNALRGQFLFVGGFRANALMDRFLFVYDVLFICLRLWRQCLDGQLLVCLPL